VEVLEGLKPGEQVVVEGASFVTAGDRVTVKR
jgi:multidrug efflux pump subunit AcrA (membrane-fusion protein)